eukprot:6172614-Pleurochrysis_carterae.AAC.2
MPSKRRALSKSSRSLGAPSSQSLTKSKRQRTLSRAQAPHCQTTPHSQTTTPHPEPSAGLQPPPSSRRKNDNLP